MGQGRLAPLWRLALGILAIAPIQLYAQSPSEPGDGLPEMLADAELNDVFFQNADQGWAVGDRGVIWHTGDGGRRWQLRPSPVSCRLESVYFVDEQHGWIVGGWSHPYTQKTRGVVLRTTDGGQRWVAAPSLTLPGLKQVKFFNARQGWAVGNGSAMYPGGVFRSEDGGRSWSPLPGGRGRGWLGGDFRDPRNGAVAGRQGRLAVVHNQQLKPSRTPGLGRALRKLRLTSATDGWMVGDGGLVLVTADGGLSWQTPPGPLPDGASELFDFSALATVDSRCWVAGSPGTCVLHSADGGRSWQVFRTDQNLPIRALTFLDEHRGWAVGAMGTILATRDGGQTWRRQQGNATRAALLALYSQAEKLPLELFAWLSGNEGYLGVAEVLGRPDSEQTDGPRESAAAERAHQALVQSGGSVAELAWQFPLPAAELFSTASSVVQHWDRANDGRAAARLQEHLVRKIRQWRPEVVVTEEASPRGGDPLAHLTNQFVLAAVQQAADQTAYPDHFALAGLEPWKVKKVFSTLGDEQGGTVTLNTAQLAPRLASTLADYAASAHGLLDDQYRPPATRVGFRLLIDHLPQETGRRDFFSGIRLAAGGEARRELGQPLPGNLETLRRMAQKQRTVQQLLAHSAEQPRTGAGWLGQVDDLTEGLNVSSAGGVLFQLARQYHQAGQLEPAAEVYQLLVQRHPDHVLAEAALIWLIQYYASSEAGWQLRRPSQIRSGQVVGAAASLPAPPVSGPRRLPPEKPELQVHNQAGVASAELRATHRAGQAVELAKQVQQTRPALFAEPAVRFPLAAALRTAGLPREAERYYHALTADPVDSAWRDCAQGELWLAHGTGQAPKSVYQAAAAAGKPHLDGKLNDPLWKNAQPVPLKSVHSDDQQWPAQVRLAYDDQFLYLAVQCRKAPDVEYPTADGPRPRDPDLSRRDRVDVLIDLDRDYATYYRLTVDHRGWTGDACLGDTSWNPQWFVAAAQDADQWTVEAAVPLNQLAAQPPQPRDVWSLGIQRTVPGLGFQSWTQPAAVRPRPEGFGWLMFE